MRSLHAPGRQALRTGHTIRGLPPRMPRRPIRSNKVVETDTDKEVTTVQPGTKIKPLALRRSPAWLSKMQGIKIMGLKPSPELVAISMVYFVQGILGLSRLALSFFFKDTLNLEPAEVALVTGLAGIPWMIKPLYGFISDSIPLWGYHRRSYLVLAGLTGFSSWVCLCFFVNSPMSAAAAMLAASLSTAASDVLVDSLVVERARDAPQATAGSLQSLCWGSAAVGGILSAYWSGSLVEHFGTRFVFGITALFPLIVSFSALLIDEQRISSKTGPAFPGPTASSLPAGSSAPGPEADREGRVASTDTLYKLHSQVRGQISNGSVHHRSPMGNPSSRSGGGDPPIWEQERAPLLTGQAAEPQGTSAANGGDATPVGRIAIWPQMVARGRMLWSAVSRKDILLPTLFVFVWQATPSAESAMFYFQTNELGFQAEFLGRVRLVSSLASLAGVLLYNTALKKVPLRTLLMWAMILGTTLGSTQLLLVSRVNVSLGLSDQLFVLGDAALLTALGQASFMPILVLAARLCPQGVEATLFATLMSVLNAGSFVGSGLGAGATKLLGVTSTDFTNLFTLVLLCNLAQLFPAPLLWLLPDSLDMDDEDNSGSGSGTFDASVMPPGQAAEGAGPHGNGNGAVADIELQATVLPSEHAPHKSVSGTEPLVLGIGDVVHASDGHNKSA